MKEQKSKREKSEMGGPDGGQKFSGAIHVSTRICNLQNRTFINYRSTTVQL